MRRAILAFLFLLIIVGNAFAWNLSISPGLSAKNAFLYLIVGLIIVEAAVVYRNSPRQPQIQSVVLVHSSFSLLILLAICSAIVIAITGYTLVPRDQDYGTLENIITLKGHLLDHYLFFFVFFYFLRDRKQVEWMIKLILVSAVAYNVVTLIDVFDVPDLGIVEIKRGRLTGALGDSNEYAALQTFVLPSLVVATLNGVKLQRLFFGVGIALSLMVLLLCASRGAVAAIFISVPVTVILLREYLSFSRVLQYGVVALLIVAVFTTWFTVQYSDILIERFIDQSRMVGMAAVTSGRSAIWGDALAAMVLHPWSFLTGYGWGAFTHFYFASHNMYLQYLYTNGIVGLTLFCTIFYGVLTTVRRSLRESPPESRRYLMAFYFGLASILATLLFVNLYEPWMFIWSYTGLMLRLAILNYTPSNNESDAAPPLIVSPTRKVVGQTPG